MIILLCIAIFLLIKSKLMLFDIEQRIKIVICFFIVLGLLVFYRCFLEYYAGWEYGIAGADMLIHFKGAELLSTGANWDSIAYLGSRFEKLGIGTIGYFLYSQLLSFMIFKPVLFDIHVNIYLFTGVQCALILITGINFANLYAKMLKQKTNAMLFTVLSFILCTAFDVSAFPLMREIWSFWLMSEALYLELNFSKFNNKIIKRTVIITIILTAILLRPYIIIILLPLWLYIKSENIGFISSTVIFGILLFSSSLLTVLAPAFGIMWGFSNYDFQEILHYLMFPNIFNQSKILIEWSYNSSTNFLGGVGLPFIDYFQSVWNAFFAYIIIIGLFFSIFKKNDGKIKLNKHGVIAETKDVFMWIFILGAFAIMYSVVYKSSTIMVRHKIMIVPSVVYITQKIKLDSFGSKKLYSFFIIIFIVILVGILAFS